MVRISEGPALLVANQGEPMSAEVVIKSLGHIGASTKAQGQAIGHKGIGFKSVLELTLRPEIYSGLRGLGPALAVGFDRERALKKIRAESDGWDEWVVDAQGPDHDNPFAAVPVLRFPHWIDPLPAEVAELASDGFDTVVRLPFDGHPGDADTWVETVRKALEDVSDRILLLLGSFEEVRIEDRPAKAWGVEVISPEWEQEAASIGPGVSREIVKVLRNDVLSSKWRLFRGALPDEADLSGEIAVGVRVDDGSVPQTVLSAATDSPAAPFHLFFPTRISSGLPFLLHAYFEVNAARTGFYDGSGPRNREMMDALAELTGAAVADLVQDESVSLASLVNLVAEAGVPEDPLAREFRENVLGRLDDAAWIPLEEDGRRSEFPGRVLTADRDLVRRIGATFPSAYVRRKTGFSLPDEDLEPSALALVGERRDKLGDKPVDVWETVGSLCRPGENPPWEENAANKPFLCLIELFAALDGRDHERTEGLLTGLRGKKETQLIPTVGADSTRTLVPIPNPRESVPGQRSQLVMARVRTRDGGGQLIPPRALDVAFLPDGLLSDEAEVARAQPLGVRPFTVVNVLDRLRGIGSAKDLDREALVRFLWQLLGRSQRATDFDPTEWFWCKPGRGRDEASSARQQRERNLSEVPLPCQDGSWQPAGRIAFGDDWADWLEKRAGGRPSAATNDRISAYRAMERLAPGPEHLLAHPDEVLGLLNVNIFEQPSSSDGQEGLHQEPDEGEKNEHMHGFLLRLGVWEVPPIEAFVSWDPGNRDRFPWPGETAEEQRNAVERNGGWKFGYGWSDRPHQNVYIAEDFRFLWPLEDMAGRGTTALVTGLRLGQRLYNQSSVALAFCPGCGGRAHTAWRHSDVADGFPSSLVVQMGNAEWVPCTVNGEASVVPTRPESAWWHRKPPTDAALRQSPWRLVPLCSPDTGMTEDLRRLSGANTMEDAGVDAVKSLLLKLRKQFLDGELPVDPYASGSARQAFVGMHRLAYDRLSELAIIQRDVVVEALQETEVLCELGEGLVYQKPDEAWHDDGRFAAYARHFVDRVPFAVLPRDRGPAAERLGINEFRLHLSRQDKSEGQDVTEELRDIHLDRIAELLAIVVHHSLAGQTLDETSRDFDTRANRLRNLRIKRVEDLAVDIVVEGHGAQETLGKGSRQDLFLETPAPGRPVLYHDLSENNWRDRLRYKIAPYLATLVENPAYAHTFALFLQRENEAEREEFLLELGISAQEVDAISARLGIVRQEERNRHQRWFAAILRSRGVEAFASDLDLENVPDRLKDAGLPADIVDRLVTLGGGEEVRRDTGDNSALRLLHEAGTDLEILYQKLCDAGDTGLDIKDARNRFFNWRRSNHRWLAVILAQRVSPEEAKNKAGSLEPLAELRHILDPSPSIVLAPVVRLLREMGVTGSDLPEQTVNRLASDESKQELANLGGFNVSELDARAKRLYNEEETRSELRDLAGRWRSELWQLATLARTGPASTRTGIREIHAEVERKLPRSPSTPAELRDATAELFVAQAELSRRIRERLVDSLDAVPDTDELQQWAREDGIAVDERLPRVREALDEPRARRVRDLKDRSEQLARLDRHPTTPEMLRRHEPDEDHGKVGIPADGGEEGGTGDNEGKVSVPPIKVGEGHDAHKRKLGDEGERWALASVIGDLMGLDREERDAALEEIAALLRSRFRDEAVDMALSHETTARRPDLDDEELFDELSGLLHVSRYSDYFGFDLIGWLPADGNGKRRAVCLEAKSSGGGGFHLSRNEWSTAERFHNGGAGDQYAVLVVVRAKGGGVPESMHLLHDPVGLEKSGRLQMQADGFLVLYGTDT